MKYLIYPIVLLAILSCKNNSESPAAKTKEKRSSRITQDSIRRSYSIGTIYKVRGEILGKSYDAFTTADDSMAGCITNGNDTVFRDRKVGAKPEFIDFDKDGTNDVMFKSKGFTNYDLIMFDSKSKTFKKIRGFNQFPAPIKIGNTKYYYSYYSSETPNYFWESDLFYIKDFKALKIGSITIINNEKENEISINKVKNDIPVFIEAKNITVLNKYKDKQWGFIKDYWTKNYSNYIN